MKFAICNETFVDWPFEKAFECARQAGYTGIEIAPFTIDPDATKISAARREQVRRQAEQAGLEVVGLHWLLAKTEGYHLTSPMPAVRRETAAYLQELARLCRDLGGRVLVFGSPHQRNLAEGVSEADGMAYAAEVLREAMPVCEECDVVLAVEPLGPAEGNFLLTAEKGIELARMVDSPRCKLHLDCKAMSTETKSFDQILRDSREWLVHFHANDPNMLGPGMGDLDFRPIFSALREIGYDGWVSVEVFDYEPGAERIARASMEYMQRVLSELGDGI